MYAWRSELRSCYREGEERGCKYIGDDEQKGYEKMTMTKKGHKNFRGKNDRMIEIKSMTSKKGHQNFRRKSRRVTELRASATSSIIDFDH